MNINDFVLDYRNIDALMRNIICLDDIKSLIHKSCFHKKTKCILGDFYEEIYFLNDYSYILLDKFPNNLELLDLTVFEGSGFYTKHDQYWLYHKGAGSVEALAIKEKFNFDATYPAFGAEYPGYLGTFASASLLGVKLLWQCFHEFISAFTLLGHAIDSDDNLTNFEELNNRYVIPLSVTLLPKLTEIINNNLQTKPGTIQKKYSNLTNLNQAAKVLMIVPSSLRGTDNYLIEGKWYETDNIFYRSSNLYPIKKHALNFCPIWREDQTAIRAKTLRLMYNAGFIYQPHSAHLQNFYYIPQPRDRSLGVNAADFCDFMPLYKFNKEELECLMLNIVNGWRVAESTGPVFTPYNENITYAQIYNLAEVFFKEFMGNQYKGGVSKLFLLLPFSTSLAIIKIFCTYQVANKNNQVTLKHVQGYLNIYEGMSSVIEQIIKKNKIDLKKIYMTIVDNRPKELVNCIYSYLLNLGDYYIKELLDIYEKTFSTYQAESDRRRVLYHLNYSIEFTIKNNGTLNNILETIESPMGIEEYLHDQLGIYILSIESNKRQYFIKNYLEEICHIKHHDLRNFIIEGSDILIIKKTCDELYESLREVIKNPDVFMNDYLGFIFKRDKVYSLIRTSSSAKELKLNIRAPWDGNERPIYRSYPTIELKAVKWNKVHLKKLLIITKIINKIGFES